GFPLGSVGHDSGSGWRGLGGAVIQGIPDEVPTRSKLREEGAATRRRKASCCHYMHLGAPVTRIHMLWLDGLPGSGEIGIELIASSGCCRGAGADAASYAREGRFPRGVVPSRSDSSPPFASEARSRARRALRRADCRTLPRARGVGIAARATGEW